MRRGSHDGGYPGQAYGLPAEGAGSVAGYGVRLLAWALDGGLLWVTIATDRWGWQAEAAGSVLWLVTFVVLPTRWGATLGQAVFRLRVVPLVDGVVLHEQRGLTVLTAFGRSLMWGCAPLTAVIAAATADDDRRTVFDRWSKAIVLEW